MPRSIARVFSFILPPAFPPLHRSHRSFPAPRRYHNHNYPSAMSPLPISRRKSKPTTTQVTDPAKTAAMLHKGRLIREALESVYPVAPAGFLDHTDAFTLLVAVLLSAQSLDKKVNQVTPELFRLAPTPAAMRDLGAERIRGIIKQIGLAPQKAKNLEKLSARICDEFHGEVPRTFEGLESLAGVGHKTASVVMMQAFGKPAFPVDTHIHRLACRWGCGDAKSVDKTETELKKWFPEEDSWGELHVRMILFGREHCPARAHDMSKCPVCSFAATRESWKANQIGAKKFIAATSHANPYEIMDWSKEEQTVVSGEPKKADKGRKTKVVSVTKPKPLKRNKRVSKSEPKKDENVEDKIRSRPSRNAKISANELMKAVKEEDGITSEDNDNDSDFQQDYTAEDLGSSDDDFVPEKPSIRKPANITTREVSNMGKAAVASRKSKRKRGNASQDTGKVVINENGDGLSRTKRRRGS